jgi:hypothetical protein
MLKYVPIISLALCFYAVVVVSLRLGGFEFSTFRTQITTFYIPLFAKIAFSLLLAWFWATIRIKASSKKASG